jgi:DNA-binding PadR family transcriptional regulator
MAVNSLAQVATDELTAPPLPRTVADTGLSVDQIEQLMTKTLHTGELTGVTLAERVALPYSLLEPLIERLRAERLVEVRGATGSGTAGYRYALTDLGRERATQYLDINRYVGPAPVSLASYIENMGALRQARPFIDRERLEEGFTHLVVPGSRARPSTAARRSFSSARRETERASSRKAWDARSAATCTSRMPSTSRGRS